MNESFMIGENIIAYLPKVLKHHLRGNKVFIVSDDNVMHYYQPMIKRTLSVFEVEIVTIEPGEASKSLKTYQWVVEKLLEKGIKRDDLLLAFGGGVVGDLAGFVASTLFRGIDYGQIPTTLLAQVDSSIGSKVAIDLKEGKNLIGAFYDPKFVFIDTYFLNTLPKRQLRSGQAEMIKAALIGDKRLYEDLKRSKDVTPLMIEKSINVKKHFVEADPFDQGKRMILNFGHTFGHAIEKAHNYQTFLHGEAISYGMLMALEIGALKGIHDDALYESVKELLLDYELVSMPLLNRSDYITHVKHDKKQTAKGMQFIVLNSIENPRILAIKEDDEVWTKPYQVKR